MSTHEELTPELQQQLLGIARETIETFIRTREKPEFTIEEPELKAQCGAFVTLKAHGHLRGCIGLVQGIKPLYQTVIDMAVAAATEDPRFSPVRENELEHLHIEISVMSPLEEIENPEDVQVGRHGIMIRRGIRSGLLLPQVATEHNWDRETFLTHTCRKAFLPDDAWKDPETHISVFSAQVFGEEES